MVNIAITGSSGRMGQALIKAVLAHPEFDLAQAIDHPDSPLVGHNAAESTGQDHCTVTVTAVLTDAPFDVLIDFTRPVASLLYVGECVSRNCSMVIGTTGFEPDQKLQLQQAAHRIPLVLAPNMSVGVNLSFKLMEMAASVLGGEADIEIIEAHHKHKVDAPSGTAIGMGEVIADALGRSLGTDGVFGRHGHTGERQSGEIGFSVIRGGDLVGDHTAMFLLEGERIEITHRATSRAIYANGALRAARWIAVQQTPGLYNMQNVLGLG